MSQLVKKIWNGFTTLLVVLAVVLAILLVGVRLIGMQVFTVLSGSMEPTYPVGALLYVKEVDPFTLQSGDVITFLIAEGTVATHRIVEPVYDEEDPSVVRFRTKGDANEAEDGSLVHCKNVIGTPVFSIPGLGRFASYIQNPPGTYVAISAGALLLLLLFLPEVLGMLREEEGETAEKPEKQKKEKKEKVPRVKKEKAPREKIEKPPRVKKEKPPRKGKAQEEAPLTLEALAPAPRGGGRGARVKKEKPPQAETPLRQSKPQAEAVPRTEIPTRQPAPPVEAAAVRETPLRQSKPQAETPPRQSKSQAEAVPRTPPPQAREAEQKPSPAVRKEETADGTGQAPQDAYWEALFAGLGTEEEDPRPRRQEKRPDKPEKRRFGKEKYVGKH